MDQEGCKDDFGGVKMLELEHVAICARDTIALKDWYVKFFQFKVVYDNGSERPTFMLLMEDKSMIEIYPMDIEGVVCGSKHQGLRHLAFGTDNIEKEYSRLIDCDVDIIEKWKTNPNGVSTFFLRDIEGNIIHFVERPEKLY
jgi:glyoxylase I family protein